MKEKILETLQARCRSLSEREEHARDCGESKISTLFYVKRLLNFHIQDLVNAVEGEKLETALSDLLARIYGHVVECRRFRDFYLMSLYLSVLNEFKLYNFEFSSDNEKK